MTAGASGGRPARSSRRGMGRCTSRLRDGVAGRAGGTGALGRTPLGGSILGASGAGFGGSRPSGRLTGASTGGGDGAGTPAFGGTTCGGTTCGGTTCGGTTCGGAEGGVSMAGATAVGAAVIEGGTPGEGATAGGAPIGDTIGGGAIGGGTAGSADGGISVAGSTVGASSVTTRGFRRAAAATAVRRGRGFGSGALSPLVATFARVLGLGGALGVVVGVSWVAIALARVGRRAAGLIGSPLPGRIVRAGIRATGCERISRAGCSSTALVKVVASIPAAWSRSRTSLVVRRNFVARSYTRTVPTLPSSARRSASSRFPAPDRPGLAGDDSPSH
jgi:hypothetical protein